MLDRTDAERRRTSRPRTPTSAEPTLPTDTNEPIEPIENDDSLDAIEQNELRDQRDNPVRCAVTSFSQRVRRELGAEALVVTCTEVR